MPRNIENSWFVRDMIKATSDMWLKGWHERNGGNLSLRLLDEDVAPYRDHGQELRSVRLGEPVPALAGQHFLVTGSGKYFRNVQLDPAANLGLIQVAPDGASVAVLWGYKDGAVPTSELASHFKSHRVRQSVTDGRDRVIMHCHATNLIALSYVLDLSTANVTRALWEMSTECVVVFPDGVGVMGWMVPGTDTIGEATARQMARHTLVLWPFHGVFATGSSLDEAFGLIDTAEKAAEILVKVITMGGARQAIGTANLRDLARRFSVEPLTEAMEIREWSLAADRRGA